MDIIEPDARNLIENSIIMSMSVIDWGKLWLDVMKLFKKTYLNSCGITAYDPETDLDCPKINIANKISGFDIVAKKKNGTYVRIQSKLRQVGGVTDYSRQIHFETTRRHSKK